MNVCPDIISLGKLSLTVSVFAEFRRHEMSLAVSVFAEFGRCKLCLAVSVFAEFRKRKKCVCLFQCLQSSGANSLATPLLLK